MKNKTNCISSKKIKGEMKSVISAVNHLTFLPENSQSQYRTIQKAGKNDKSHLTSSYLFLPETVPKASYLNYIVLT